jgi:hypothetical protein
MDNQSFVFNALYSMHCSLCNTGCSSPTLKIEVAFHMKIKLRSSSIYKKRWGHLPVLKNPFIFHSKKKEIFEVVFHLKTYLRSSSIYKNIWSRLPFTKIFEVVFPLQKYLRLSSIYRNIWGCLAFVSKNPLRGFRTVTNLPQQIFEVVFHLKTYLRSSSI